MEAVAEHAHALDRTPSVVETRLSEPDPQPEPAEAVAESTVAGENPDEKAAANDWWARQLGRRKKD